MASKNKPKIGVAMSVYNKGKFVATNVNVIRHVWKAKVKIAVCCNDPGTYDKLQFLDIDSLVKGIDYPVTSKKDLRLRQYDTIKKSVSAAAVDTDYVIHWHADAFALDDEAIAELINYMQKNNIDFAARGFWKDSWKRRGIRPPHLA